MGRYEAAEFNQLEAAELLGVDERTFRRWRQRFEDDGEAGLLDRRLGKASGKRVPIDREHEVEALYRERYQGFTAKHFHEHLVAKDNFAWSVIAHAPFEGVKTVRFWGARFFCCGAAENMS